MSVSTRHSELSKLSESGVGTPIDQSESQPPKAADDFLEMGNGKEGYSMVKMAKIAGLIAMYLTLNSSLNLLNKWALASFFPFPLLLTTVHMGFSFFALLPVMMTENFRSLHAPTLKRQWFGLVCIGLFMAINIGLNNLSLVLISLSLNQVIRSAIPVATAMLAVLIESRTPTSAELTALLVLTMGVMLSVWEGAKGSTRGITYAVMGMISNAAMMSTSGKVLSEKMDVFRLSFYTAPVSCLALLPFVYWREASRFQEFMTLDYRAGVAIMVITSANALAYNVVHNAMIKMTSAVTTTVIGEAKIVGLFILSALLLDESKEFTATMTAGVVLAMVGFGMYSWTKLASRSAESKPEHLTRSGAFQPLRNSDMGVEMSKDPEKQPLRGAVGGFGQRAKT